MISDIYYNLQDAVDELKKRRQDNHLKEKVRDLWKENAPDFLPEEPFAALSRSIFTPNIEFAIFLEKTKQAGLTPLLLEFNRQNKFVARNIEKYHLARLFFIGKMLHGNPVPSHVVKIVDFNKNEGRELSGICTIWGEGLVDFHHRMFSSSYPEQLVNIIDYSDWFLKTRELTEFYYLYHLSLFIRDGILLENFIHSDPSEKKFFEEKIKPSIIKLEKIFGVRPLIVSLEPIEKEHKDEWHWFIEGLATFVPVQDVK